MSLAITTGVLLGEACDDLRIKCAVYDGLCTKGKCVCKDDYKNTDNLTYCYQGSASVRV